MRSIGAILVFGLGLAAWPATAETVTSGGQPVYITRADCNALVAHRPDADVAYQPGRDVHGKYVAPADLPGSNYGIQIPDKIQFNVTINPVLYQQQRAGGGTSSPYANTQAPVARVEVNLATGETKINGQSLTDEQDRIVRDACRKAGIR